MKNIKRLIIISISALAFSAAFSSCMIFKGPDAKIKRKDEAALQRVMAKINLAHQVYIEQAKLHPCNDSIVKFIPGKRDSIYFPVPVYVLDSNKRKRIIDSLHLIYAGNMEEAMAQALLAGYEECAAERKNVKIPLPVHDTVRYEDGRKIEAWRLDAQQWKEKYIAEHAVNEKVKEDSKGKLQIQWWLAILFAIVLIGIGFLISKFSK